METKVQKHMLQVSRKRDKNRPSEFQKVFYFYLNFKQLHHFHPENYEEVCIRKFKESPNCTFKIDKYLKKMAL